MSSQDAITQEKMTSQAFLLELGPFLVSFHLLNKVDDLNCYKERNI